MNHATKNAALYIYNASSLDHLLVLLSRIIMEVQTLGSLLDDTSTNRPITKVLALILLLCISLDHWLQDLEDLVFADGSAVQFGETLAVVASS